MLPRHTYLAVIQADLQLICSMRHALEGGGLGALAVARNGQEAILYLRGVGIYADRRRYPLPSAVILDCDSPNGEDLEVLAWMRERRQFWRTPVVMLCREEHQLHITCALDSACLMVDRRDLGELVEALESLRPFEARAAA